LGNTLKRGSKSLKNEGGRSFDQIITVRTLFIKKYNMEKQGGRRTGSGKGWYRDVQDGRKKGELKRTLRVTGRNLHQKVYTTLKGRAQGGGVGGKKKGGGGLTSGEAKKRGHGSLTKAVVYPEKGECSKKTTEGKKY